MKQIYLIHEHHPRLLLFFAGWGADETPFKNYRPADSDYMLCYDYRSLDFDTSLLAEYTDIRAVGWSMGVWAATRIMASFPLPVSRRIAINGTPFPIDEELGIPPAIFQGTLDGLTDVSLHKFLRRMCADSAAFKEFLQRTPRRPLEELREELAAIAHSYTTLPPCEAVWDLGIVGAADRIIPPTNQERAWKKLGVPIRQTADAHYQEALFHRYLQDVWTND